MWCYYKLINDTTRGDVPTQIAARTTNLVVLSELQVGRRALTSVITSVKYYFGFSDQIYFINSTTTRFNTDQLERTRPRKAAKSDKQRVMMLLSELQVGKRALTPVLVPARTRAFHYFWDKRSTS